MSERPLVSFKSASGRAFDAVLILDGQDISRMASGISIQTDAGGVPHVEIRLTFPALDIETRADVTFVVTAHPGYVVLSEPLDNGGMRYRTAREDEW